MGIAIVGHFGGKEKFNDGQTIKTIAIYDALIRYGERDVKKIDTYYIKRNPLKFLWLFISALCKDQKYIVLLSSNGRRVLFPILSFMSRYMKKEVYHYGIGGRLATVYKGNIIKNLIMDCQSYTKYRPNETTGGIFVSWRRKEELPTGA